MTEGNAQHNTARDGGTVNAVHNGNLITVVQTGDPPPGRRPWMIPAADPEHVVRTDLGDRVDGMLDGQGPVMLFGAGGFGKTVLATQVCHRTTTAERFPAGLLWATIGPEISDPDLASRLNDLSAHLSGRRPAYAAAEQAGFHFGRLLDDLTAPLLLVIDDVWRSADLAPFLSGGRCCQRLVTTRDQRIGDPSRGVLVDRMAPAEARMVLACGMPGLPVDRARDLSRVTGRWPLLLRLANRALRRTVARGTTATEAAERLAHRFAIEGPGGPESPVAGIVEASLALLPDQDRERYAQLSVFAPDTDISGDLLDLLWGQSSDRLCEDLADLSLVDGYRPGPRTLRLHPVLRDHLRRRLGDRAREISELLLRRLNPGGVPWWDLPAAATALVAWHLAGAGRQDEVDALVTDPRWIETRVRQDSPAAAERDLDRSGTDEARTMAAFVRRTGHLLAPVQPPQAIGAILRSRLADVAPPGTGSGLVNRWPLPDRPPARLRRTLAGHTGAVVAVVVSGDGEWIASGAWDRTVRIWEARTGRSAAVLGGFDAWIADMAAAPDDSWLLTVDRHDRMRIWETGDWQCRHTVDAGHRHTTGVAVSPDGSWAVTTGRDGAVTMWDTATWRVRQRLSGPAAGGWKPVIAPDGDWLAATGRDGTVHVWDTDGKPLNRMDGGRGLAVAPSGSWLAAGADDGVIRLWETSGWTLLDELGGHAGPVLAVTTAGGLLVGAGEDRTIRLWDVAAGQERGIIGEHTAPVNGVVFGPGADQLVSCGADGKVRIWDVTCPDSETPAADRGHVGGARGVRKVGGRRFVTVGWDRTARVWDLDRRRALTVLGGHRGTVVDAAVSPDGRRAVTTSSDGSAVLWDLPEGRRRALLRGHGGGAWATAFAPDGSWLVTTSMDARTRVWDTGTGHLLRTLHGHIGPVTAVAVAPDGEWFATAGTDRTVRLWTPAGQPLSTLRGHRRGIWSLDRAPDGSWLVSGGIDGSVRRWEIPGGESRPLTDTAPDGVWSIAVSADGRLLALAGGNTLRVVDAEDGTPVAAMRVDGDLEACAWPTDRSVAAAGSGGVYVFDLR